MNSLKMIKRCIYSKMNRPNKVKLFVRSQPAPVFFQRIVVIINKKLWSGCRQEGGKEVKHRQANDWSAGVLTKDRSLFHKGH